MATDNTDHISFVLKALESQNLAGRFDPAGLHTFLDELFRWNPRLGLVSKQDTPRITAALIGQSVRLWDYIVNVIEFDPRGCRVADIGTGGGFPGLIWAFVEPEMDMVLIERKVRKTAFLERVAVRAGMENIRVEGADLAEIARRDEYRRTFNMAVMMAVTRPDGLAPDINGLLENGGLFCTIRSATEPVPPPRIGDRLTVLATQKTSDGCFAVYQKSGPHDQGDAA